MILRALEHVGVKMASAQRLLYQCYARKAEECIEDCTPHIDQAYTIVVDYGQNMDLLIFNK